VTAFVELIADLIRTHDLLLEGFTARDLAWEVFKYGWGLGPIHDLYLREDVYEVRVDRADLVSVSRRGKNEIVAGAAFRSEAEIDRLVRRLIAYSGYDLFDESHPRVNVVLPLAGGTRLTAVRPPLAEYTGMCLRKLNAFPMTKENLVRAGTVNERVYDIIALLHRCGGKVLWLGPPESGKTSWIAAMVNVLPESVRVVMIGKDREFRLRHLYPNRSVVELEERERVRGGSLVELFGAALKLSPDAILFDEFLVDEIAAAVMAGERARWFWSTSHYAGPHEAVLGGATLLLRHSPTLTYDAAVQQFLRAFNTFVVLHADMVRGVKKVLGVYVGSYGEKGPEFRALVEWKGSGEDYWRGDWTFPERPFTEHLDRMRMFGATDEDFAKVGWL